MTKNEQAKPKPLSENVEEEIKNKVDEFNEKIDEKIGQKIEEDIERVVEKEVEKRVEERVKEKLQPSTIGEIRTFEDLKRGFKEGRENVKMNLRNCLDGSCRLILYYTILGYLVLAIFSALCVFFTDFDFCLTSGFFGATLLQMIVVTAIVIGQVFIAYHTEHRISSAVFSFLLDIPLLVFLLFFVYSYLAAIILIAILVSYYLRYRE